MDELQTKLWDALCELSGEEVARIFTNYYGNQLLDKGLEEWMIDNGYLWSEEEWEEN